MYQVELYIISVSMTPNTHWKNQSSTLPKAVNGLTFGKSAMKGDSTFGSRFPFYPIIRRIQESHNMKHTVGNCLDHFVRTSGYE